MLSLLFSTLHYHRFNLTFDSNSLGYYLSILLFSFSKGLNRIGICLSLQSCLFSSGISNDLSFDKIGFG